MGWDQGSQTQYLGSLVVGSGSVVLWDDQGQFSDKKNALIGRTCSRLKTQLYFWRNNLSRYLSVRNTTFFLIVHRWLSAGSCLAIDSFCFDSFFCNTIPYIHWNIELVWVFWLPNKDLRKNPYNGHYLLQMISLCTLNNYTCPFFDNNRWSFSTDKINPVITAVVIALDTVNFYCIFLLTMLKRPYMVSCKPLAAPDSKPLMNANCF